MEERSDGVTDGTLAGAERADGAFEVGAGGGAVRGARDGAAGEGARGGVVRNGGAAAGPMYGL